MEKELFGLKDEKGKEYKLRVESYREGFTISAILPVEEKLEYGANLIKLAKEKGLTRIGAKVKDADDGLVSVITGSEVAYRNVFDSLVIDSKGDHMYTITNLYYQGKWAEIIPEKKLPKTKREAEEFLTEYAQNGNIRNFLKNYED